ncbi:Serine/threonine-protein kinase ppk6 [Cyphellophora attinorum]|uniref:non-specific serine/threonine protein kinase n=1 Tax=Cyphellophora attinorum TaxID=1664694 RepID=A0A0N1P1F3_9EURO|nr:Serine/threonine-protein kinase ppk6 [Phialophora attinorum]KPI44294.1 Serine/threonine-protein kinase ppk6 [Phialophora attinorum]
MTEGASGSNESQIKATLSPELGFGTSPSQSPDLSIRIPKNKSTGNLLAVRDVVSAGPERTRFSFDAGSTQDVRNQKRPLRPENDLGLGMSGLRRIRRPPVPSRTPSLIVEDVDTDWTAPALQYASTLPVSRSSSRSMSRSASFGYLASGPSSPVLEDLHRFPAESLHSFSFSKQSEDYLHSRQTIIQKAGDFVRDRSAWVANPALADARARVSGDVEIQGMMDLLKKANIIPADKRENHGLGLGPMTGPADVDRNIFDRSFSQSLESVEEGVAVLSPLPRSPQQSPPPPPPTDTTQVRPPLERTASNEELSPTAPRRIGLKRTYTDLNAMSLQQRLIDALAQPYSSEEHIGSKPKLMHAATAAVAPSTAASAVHTHSSKYTPAAQAVFRTGGEAPWTILAANDLACLIFGVTRAEVRSLSILGIIQEDRRAWLEEKLGKPTPEPEIQVQQSTQATAAKSSLLGAKSGITARLLSKAPSRVTKPAKRAQTDDGSGGYYRQTSKNHPPTKSRGVLLCGDVIPIQRRNGSVGSASFWVMEKKGGLIWVIEEIREDVAHLSLDSEQRVTVASGACEAIWGTSVPEGTLVKSLIPTIPDEMSFFERRTPSGQAAVGHFTARTANGVNIPTTITKVLGKSEFRVSSLPHIAGMMVLDPETLNIKSSNSVFSASLFGYEHPGGLSMATLVPRFQDILDVLTEENGVDLADGLVVPEHSFRRAYSLLSLRDGADNAANVFLRPSGLPAKHRDGTDIMVDIQMRVVRSETVFPVSDQVIKEQPDAEEQEEVAGVGVVELVFALWITYSRQLHAAGQASTDESRPFTPPHQVGPDPAHHLPSPPPRASSEDTVPTSKSADSSQMSLLSPTTTLEDSEPLEHPPPNIAYVPHDKKTIADFTILEEMGSGAYGQVKLGRYRKGRSRKVVLKYVTKSRILVDTWTRDRRLGTVPLEIHVMDYLRRDGFRHPNIVEMIDFFEDNVNYYIEMLPHGIPGMDLFDYIELRSDMAEDECRSIFRQVASAIHHLHIKAAVVHRDIKDENVVLDGEGKIKLIDFGSAAYLKNGPFDVFVGTIDYAAPEVLQGKAYGGKEQDVWAMGILLYTIVYKENPFYNIDEILDHPLRIPYNPYSDECLDLIQKMLDRDVDERIDIEGVVAHPWLAVES